MEIKIGNQDFEHFLMDVFAKGDGATLFDDDLADAYADWSSELHIDEVIKYAEEWMAQETAFSCDKCKRGV
jgi:hypothetical protein